MTRPGCLGNLMLVLALLLLVLCGTSSAQFTQGPPGNPSAAGITTGTAPPAPAPPHVVAPPPSGAPPATGPVIIGMQANPSTGGADAITSPGWVLSVYGMPAALLGNESGRRALTQRLKLSPEQTERLERIHDQFDRQTRTIRYDLLQKRIEIQQLFSDPASNQTLVLSKQKEFTGLLESYMDQAAKAAIEARAILRPEQIERLDTVMQR